MSYTSVKTEEDDDIHSISDSRINKEKEVIANKKDSEDLLEEDASLWEKFVFLISRSLPISLGFFLNLASSFINLLFAGRYEEGDDKTVIFAGVSLSNMFFNIATLSLIVGMTTAVETLSSYDNGNGNYKQVGITFHRSNAILFFMVIWLIPILLSAGDIFEYLGIDEAVCEVVRNFLKIRLLTIPCDIVAESWVKHIMAVGVIFPTIVYSTVFNGTLLCLDLFLVSYMKAPYEALAWSFVISAYVALTCSMLVGFRYQEVSRTMVMLDKNTLKEVMQWDKIWQFVTLGFPGMAMLCSEWWAYELLTVMAGILGRQEVTAQSILMQILSLSFMLPLGMGIAACSIIGNSLGANRPRVAKEVGKIAMAANCFIEIIVGGVIYYTGRQVTRIFTRDEVVEDMVASCLGVMWVFVFFDGLQGVASGVLRGCGKQSIGAIINVIAFYLIGIPLAYLLAFKMDIGVGGLIKGISFASLFQCCVLLYFLVYKEEDTYEIKFTTDGGGDTDTDAENNLDNRQIGVKDDVDVSVIDVDKDSNNTCGYVQLELGNISISSSTTTSQIETADDVLDDDYDSKDCNPNPMSNMNIGGYMGEHDNSSTGDVEAGLGG